MIQRLAVILAVTAPALLGTASVRAAGHPYLFEVLAKQPYRSTWDDLLARSKPVPAWILRFSRTYDGVTKPSETMMVAGAPYEVYTLCKPHDCADNHFEILFSRGGTHAWGALVSDAGPPRFLGQPGPAITEALNQILDAKK